MHQIKAHGMKPLIDTARRLAPVSRMGLTPEQNERVRKLVRECLARPDMNQPLLAKELDVTQGQISGLLSERQGTTFPFVVKLARYLKKSEWEILGMAPPPRPAQQTPRELAADLARAAGVSEEAIASVLAEPIPPERDTWPALWWANRMVRRDAETLPGPPPEEPIPKKRPKR